MGQPEQTTSLPIVVVPEELFARQERRGWLSEADIEEVAGLTRWSTSELYGAVSAYPRLLVQPTERWPLVCGGPVCSERGSKEVCGSVKGAETTCLGLCDQPVAALATDGSQMTMAPGAAGLSYRSPTEPVVAAPGSTFFGTDDPWEAVSLARSMQADELLELISRSNLRGRGGAGFPVSQKWASARQAEGYPKFVICNADESEPGTFKDRALLDHQPRRVLAGLAIAAHFLGAEAAIIYIRYEYRPQHDRLIETLSDLKSEGHVGDGFDVVICRGAGLYVCGEESALLNSIEGARPVPRDRPPYPVDRGLYGQPTLVSNVETLAAIPAILGRTELFDGRPGKLYCVSGDAETPGVYEFASPPTARELLNRAGIRADRLSGFSMGGISGGLLPVSAGHVTLDFDGPPEHGAYLGSGALIALGRERCVASFALEALRFFAGESCGKCFPCRIGTTRLKERLEMLLEDGRWSESEITELLGLVSTGSACGLGPGAALMVSHLVRYFPAEIEGHRNGECSRGEA